MYSDILSITGGIKNGSIGQCDCTSPCSYNQYTSLISYGSIPSLSVAHAIADHLEVEYRRYVRFKNYPVTFFLFFFFSSSICDISLFVYFAVHDVYILFCLYVLLFLWRRDLYEMAPNKCSLYVCMYVYRKFKFSGTSILGIHLNTH